MYETLKGWTVVEMEFEEKEDQAFILMQHKQNEQNEDINDIIAKVDGLK